MEREDEERGSGFLPPEPAGPEPELEDRPEPAAQPQAPQHPQAPQQPQQTYGYPPPPPGQPYYPPPPQQPPPGYPPPPPGYGPPPGQAYPAWGYQQPRVPDNGQAVAGFVLSLVSVGLLVISFGLSSIISVGLAIGGIVCSRIGKRKVDRGESPKHRGLAQAGYIIGWVSLALSVLATIAWVAVIIAEATQDESIFDESNSISVVRQALGG
jgi:hypothetical protein